MIEIINYTKTIKDSTVLKGINLQFENGIVYGLKGINGSGKTMLMRAVCGLINPTEGKVVIDGQVLGDSISFPPSIGVLIENPAFIDWLTGYKNLEQIASLKRIAGKDEIRSALSAVGLDPDDKRKYRKYSLGMKQKLGIASAIMESPDILILDEPLNALDESGTEMVHEIVRKFKKNNSTVILTCHDEEELRKMSDIIIQIEKGAIVGEERV